MATEFWDNLRNFDLNTKFSGRLIGYNSLYQLSPARSPDLIPMNILVQVYLKFLVYRIEIITRNQLSDEIQVLCDALGADKEMVSHNENAVIRRAELCHDNYDRHFEFVKIKILKLL